MSCRGLPSVRILDYLAGIPATALLALARRRRPRPDDPSVIFVLPASSIGDTLLTGVILAPIRRAFPGATILSGSFPSNRAAVELLGGVDGIVPLDLLRPLDAVHRIRAEQPDVVVDASPWPKAPAVLAALSGAYTVGFRRRGHARHLALDAVVEHSDDRHEIENHAALLSGLGLPREAACPTAIDLVVEPVPGGVPPHPFVVLHPWASGSGKRLKEWPKERWLIVAGRLAARGYHIVVTGGPLDREDTEALVAYLRKGGLEGVQDLSGKLSLGASGRLMREASLVLSVNTGTMHLAALLGARVVGLHGPTDPARWGPVGPRVRCAGPAEGGGFLSLGYEYRNAPTDTMERLSAEEVLARAAELLDGEL